MTPDETTLWERRQKGARTALAKVACSIPAPIAAATCVVPYRSWIFSQDPKHVSVGVEICQSDKFPTQLFKLLSADVVAEGVSMQVIERILADAGEMLGCLDLEHVDRKKAALYGMMRSALSPETTAMLTPSTIEHMVSYPYMSRVYLLYGQTRESGAVVMHLRPCARPAGDRRNAALCVAAHHNTGEAVALAALALRMSNLEETQRLARQARFPQPPPIPGEVGPTVLGAARYFFTTRVRGDDDAKARFVKSPPACLAKFAQRRLREAVGAAMRVGPAEQ